jgi:hypothetical protein
VILNRPQQTKAGDRKIDGQMDSQMNGQMYKLTDWQIDEWIGGQTQGRTDKKAERQMD